MNDQDESAPQQSLARREVHDSTSQPDEAWPSCLESKSERICRGFVGSAKSGCLDRIVALGEGNPGGRPGVCEALS
jgi:hypothetical protein